MTKFPAVPPEIGVVFQTAISAVLAQPDNNKHTERYLREIQSFCDSPTCNKDVAAYLYITVYDQLINLWAITSRLNNSCPELIRDRMIDREREVTDWLSEQLRNCIAAMPT